MTSTENLPLVAAIGDLIEDVVVDLREPIRHGTDTDVRVHRRRGGSAANVAVAAVEAGVKGRFLGNVGADDVGDRMLARLESAGVDARVTRGGRTGTVVALIDTTGERSLLTDRGSSAECAELPGSWLHAVDAVHVPAYAFTDEPLASVAAAILDDARHVRELITSIDASAVPVIEAIGITAFRELVGRLEPTVVFCNDEEAAALGVDRRIGGSHLTVVKRGSASALIHSDSPLPIEVPAIPDAHIVDTTGAGDAFAAAFLTGLALGLTPEKCARSAHGLAARSLGVSGALQGPTGPRDGFDED